MLVEAFKRLPKGLPVALEICASANGAMEQKYCDHIQHSVSGDCRIRVNPPMRNQDVATFLSKIDVLAIPSQWLETGPLVLLEAFAAGTPIIGSDLGGISELVDDGKNGVLVPHDDVNAWTAAMIRLATEPNLVCQLRKGIGQIRTMSDVGSDMATLYSELVGIKRHAA